MASIYKLLKKMVENIEETKKNINLFYQNQKMTMTDLYRAQYYADLIEKNIDRLKYYLDEHRKISPQNKQEYTRNLNNISIQTNILKATQQAMDDEMIKIKKSGDIQQNISGKLINSKKELNHLLSKAEKLLKRG